MRTTGILLLTLALVALPHVAAQAPSFSEAYQVRGAVGDIPTTPARETEGVWNLEQLLAVPFDNTSAEAGRTFHFVLPAGAVLDNATCDCARSRHTLSGSTLAFTIEPLTESGSRAIRILTHQPAGEVFGSTLRAPFEAPADRAVILYVPGGSDLDSNADFTRVGTSPSDTSKVIHFARFDTGHEMSGDLWFAIHPATVAGAVPDDGFSVLDWIVPVLVGLVLGALLWAALVSRGVVQKKSRKQVATTAAHVEAAANDQPAVLEGKKRALLAALKEVELARQANEMPVEVYDVVKADLKKQAVTVMRALETGDPPKA